MKKKITAIILTISMCVSMSGCSDDGTSAEQVEYGYFIELESNEDMTIVYARGTEEGIRVFKDKWDKGEYGIYGIKGEDKE